MLLRWCSRAVFVVLWLFSATSQARETLRVLTWPGYADHDLVEAFEKSHNAHVEVTFITTDDDLRERLDVSKGKHFDVFAANTAELSRYIEQGFSLPLKLDQIPNIQHQLARFQDLSQIPGISRDKQVFAIPFTYSEMGLIYNRKLIPTPPTSINAMWDPAFRGQVLAYDGSSHSFSLAAQASGLAQPFQIDETQWPALTQKLIALRRNVLTFYTQPEEVVDWFKKAPVALVFANYGSQQVKQLQDAGADIGYVIPQEGALTWLDCWSILNNTPVPALAHAWINYMLEPAASQALVERQGLNNTMQSPNADREREKLVWLQPVEDINRRKKLWNSIRSGDAL